MPIAKITGQGLMAIALSVALLWGCLIGERVLTRQAFRERARVMRSLGRLRHGQPVSAPQSQSPRIRREAL